MRGRVGVVLSGWIFWGASAFAAESGTVFVIPGRPDVPVFVNPYGFDASYTVVEGDFGLDRPGQVNPIIIAGPHVLPPPSMRRYYFPRTGHEPGYGRLEVQPPPNRRVPPPAQTYTRSWGTASDPLPASTDPPYPITVQPMIGPYGPWGPWGRGGGGHHRLR
jgi:hypothetical protein